MPTLSSLFKRTNRNAGWFAIGISEQGVHWVRIKNVGNRPQVAMCLFYPETIVTPATLEKMRKDARVGGFQFTTVLTPGEYQMLLVDAPNVPVDELKTAIRWRIKDTLSYHIDDATVDVLQIPINKYGGDRPQSLYAVAASNLILQKKIALFENAKIELGVIDIPEMAQRNIAELFETEGRALAMLVFDDSGGLLTFTCDGELYLSRRLEITRGQLQDANDQLRQQYRDRVELEVQRSLDYFDRQFHHIPVSRLLISAPEQSELVKMLSANLDVKTEKLDIAQVMDIEAVPDLAQDEFVALALPALGAALRHERRAL
ncbi:MAG: agglutinin biogenesis protein MshI [Gallionellaceae bacterium]|nr:agglutinin biogenesis protein MshI [Gallionellaceae bacterium]